MPFNAGRGSTDLHAPIMLTPKQELFAQAVASGKTQADAYRASRDCSRMKDKTIQENASRLMADSKVLARVTELRKPIIEEVGYSLEAHLKRLEVLSIKAAQAGQFGPAVSAEISRGKASGHYVTKVDANITQAPTSIMFTLDDGNDAEED